MTKTEVDRFRAILTTMVAELARSADQLATFCIHCQEAADHNFDLEENQASTRDLFGRAA